MFLYGGIMAGYKRSEATVQKILDVSLKLFLEKGYEETTILDIVDQLGGLTRGAFYHHFKSKEEVLNAINDRMFLENNPFEKIRNEKNMTGLEKLKHVIKYQFSNQDVKNVNMMSLPLLKNPRILVDCLETNQRVVAPMFQELIEEGIRDGSIHLDPKYTKIASEFMMLFSDLWLAPVIFPSDPQEMKQRLYFSKELYEKLGLPLFDDEIISYMEHMIDQIGEMNKIAK